VQPKGDIDAENKKVRGGREIGSFPNTNDSSTRGMQSR
jgi:hypothetical protein